MLKHYGKISFSVTINILLNSEYSQFVAQIPYLEAFERTIKEQNKIKQKFSNIVHLENKLIL